MKAKLSGFARGSNNKTKQGEGKVMAVCCRKYLLKFSRVEVSGNSGYTKDQADVPYTVVNNCLEGGRIRVRSAVPSADKEERYNTDSLSPNKNLEKIICGYQNNYCD